MTSLNADSERQEDVALSDDPRSVAIEAERLFRGGFAIAAAMTARVALQQCILRLAKPRGVCCASMGETLVALAARGLVDDDRKQCVLSALKTANRASHGRPVAVTAVAGLIATSRAMADGD